jgi:dynein light intermediate chain 1
MIVLDWTKPSAMVRELLHWLTWVDSWAARVDAKNGDGPELRERCTFNPGGQH